MSEEGDEFFELSTYVVPVTVTDKSDGTDFNKVADSGIKYKANKNRKNGKELFSFTEQDPEIDKAYGDDNEFQIRIIASDMDVPKEIFEEIRITPDSGNGTSAVVLQRKTKFTEVITEP